MHHPNKEIRAAVEEAISAGWRLLKAGPRAHIWGTLFCPRADRDGCRRTVYSTPRSPQDHASDIRRSVANCPHYDDQETTDDDEV